MKVLNTLAVLGLSAAVSLSAFAANTSMDKEAIAERLQPIGALCLQGEDCGGVVAAPAAGPAKSPEETYNTGCMACHNTGAAGAPKKGDVAAWEPRLAQGMDTLYTHAINGFNAMPARGGNPSLSDDEVKGAVDYLVENSQ